MGMNLALGADDSSYLVMSMVFSWYIWYIAIGKVIGSSSMNRALNRQKPSMLAMRYLRESSIKIVL